MDIHVAFTDINKIIDGANTRRSTAKIFYSRKKIG